MSWLGSFALHDSLANLHGFPTPPCFPDCLNWRLLFCEEPKDWRLQESEQERDRNDPHERVDVLGLAVEELNHDIADKTQANAPTDFHCAPYGANYADTL